MQRSRTLSAAGVPSTALGTGDATPAAPAEATRLGHFNFDDLVVGMFKELARAARTGLTVEVLEQAVTRTDDGLPVQELIAISATNRQAILEMDRAHWEAQKRAAQQEIEMTPPDREYRKAEWRDREASAHDRLQEVLTELAKYEEASPTALVADQIQTFGDQLCAVVETFLGCQDRVSQQDRQAFDIIAPNYRVYQTEDGAWRASADVRLPLPDGGLGIFGPLDWPAGTGGRGSTVLRAKAPETAEAPNRDQLIEKLSAYPQIMRSPLLMLLNAPFKELPFVVMNGIDGAEFPAWVGPEWRTKPFVEWVTRTYTEALPSWGNASWYSLLSRERLVATQFAALKGCFSEDQLLELLDHSAPRFIDWASRDQIMNGDRNQLWHAAVERVSSPGRVTLYTNVMCTSGHKATLVARVPEVPRDLLCSECMTMPEPERFNMPVDVVFPKAYAEAFGFGLDECLADLRHKWSKKPFKPSGIKVAILDALSHGPLGAQDVALAVGLPLQRVNAELRDLRWKRMVVKGEGRPAQWRLIASVPPPPAPRARPLVDQVPEHQICGPFYGMGDTSQVTGFSPTELVRRRERHRIFFVGTGTRWFYPVWQFNEKGQVDPRLESIIAQLAGTDWWLAGAWLVTPHRALDGLSPRDHLLAGNEPSSVLTALEADRDALRQSRV